MSQYTNQTQQSTVIPGSLSKIPLLIRNNLLLDTNKLAYTQYVDISNDITLPINNNNVHRVHVTEKNMQNLIPPLIGSLDKVSSTEPKTKSFNLGTLQKIIGYHNMIKAIKHRKLVS